MIVTKVLSAKIKKKTLVFPVTHVKLVFQSLCQSSSSFVRMNRMRPSFQTLTTSTSILEITAFRESHFSWVLMFHFTHASELDIKYRGGCHTQISGKPPRWESSWIMSDKEYTRKYIWFSSLESDTTLPETNNDIDLLAIWSWGINSI